MPAAPPTLDSVIKWDKERIEQAVVNGTPEAHFTFNLTNVSSEVVTISAVTTSCGCTVAKLPEQPWHLGPGSNGQISATMNLAGKSGTTVKTLTVMTENNKWAPKLLFVQSTILPAAAPQPMSAMDRDANQNLAKADRQAIFKGDCVRCHVEPAKNKFGQDLYTAACGICHEAEHRATMVADLHKLPHETNAGFWRNWIAHGKSDSLMPAFAVEEGGILSREQIESLVSYLSVAIPSKPGLPPAPKPTASLK
jgi:mono/diheme cytochrome c family protein